MVYPVSSTLMIKAGIVALTLKENLQGTVTVVCMGPPQANVAIKKLFVGCDDAILLSGKPFQRLNTYATAHVIAGGLKDS